MLELTDELSRELREKYNPEGSTLRRAQLRMVEMLQFIDKVCADNGIEYWLDYGTLLGAVRHGGFIPWDDDADIAMTWKDYRKFRKVMLKNNPSEEFALQCHKTDKGCFRVWGSVRDLTTECLQDSRLHEFQKYRGLNIDIFIYRDLYQRFFSRLLMHINCKKVEKRLHQGKKDLITKIYYGLLEALRPVAYLLARIFSGRREDLHHLYGTGFSEWHLKKNVCPLSKVQFEGARFNAPGDVEGYLKEMFGETWNLIPEEQYRETHEIKVLFNKK